MNVRSVVVLANVDDQKIQNILSLEDIVLVRMLSTVRSVEDIQNKYVYSE
jgi:hypothetical protein